MIALMIMPMAQNSSTIKRVVIVGGGFGGVRLAHLLRDIPDIDTTLVSDRDYFAYYPQLYHAATGGTRSQSALPLSDMFMGTKIRLVLDGMTELSADSKEVVTTSGQRLPYDYVVLALGNVTNYFGIQGLEEFSYNIKTMAGAEDFKTHLHTELIENKRPEAHYVVVGAGPTGVELAAALGDYLHRIIALHHIKTPKYRIDLVESAPRVLPRSAEKVSARVARRLEKLGVNVMTGATVMGETATSLMLKGETIKTSTVIWTAGVANHPFFKQHEKLFKLAKNGRVEVDTHLQASKNIYVIGDNAATTFGGQAQTAINDANFVAADLARQLHRQPRIDYKPKRPVSVIPVGVRWAAVEWGSLRLYGWIGWALRRFADLVGYADIERFRPALRVWVSEPNRDDKCAICQPETKTS